MRLLALALLVSFPALADEPPKDASVPASAWLPEIEAPSAARVQRRFVTKASRVFLDAGPEYFARGDFFVSAGAAIGALAWLDEGFAIDLAGSRYFPFLTQAAEDVKKATGLVPDARAPYWLVRAGIRGAPGYGKLLVGDGVVHVEPQVFVRGALLLNDGSFAPGLDGGAALVVHWTRDLHTRLEFAVFAHAEKRTGWTFALAAVPFVSLGWGAPAW